MYLLPPARGPIPLTFRQINVYLNENFTDLALLHHSVSRDGWSKRNNFPQCNSTANRFRIRVTSTPTVTLCSRSWWSHFPCWEVFFQLRCVQKLLSPNVETSWKMCTSSLFRAFKQHADCFFYITKWFLSQTCYYTSQFPKTNKKWNEIKLIPC